ncbi:restriction endonuclease subunit S [Pedobacter alluvionis]|uniref:Type I restriction enzyme S subunit n=2 Tax=Pedobacter alluvionis TaxID=475253 RepID=A0A497XTJ5_9SPHI|nr:restriction endonuclease subunit S [Pedobacter alluvionis]RLJ72649.1 type I restriction enzyme S subunit [Pedobacter alluvionis]
MTKKEEVRRVPNLRFKGFEEEWEQRTLSDLGDFIGGGTPSSSNSNFWNGDIPWISSSDLVEDNIHSMNVSRFITEEAINKSSTKLCKAPIILIVSRVGVGKVAYSHESICTSQDFTNIVNFKCNGLFLSYFLSVEMKNSASSLQGTSIKGISSSDIKSKKLFIPNDNEQQRIATFLLLLDNRIRTQSKIIQRLETSMQNLRKRLFTQKYRFKDNFGKSFIDWEIKRLGDIATRITNKNKENNINVLTISAQYGLISQLDFFNKSVSAKDLTGYFLLSKNYFAYNKSYSNGYPMGAIKRLKNYEKGVVSTLYICFDFNSDIDLDFMEHLFEGGIQNSELEKIAQEGARNHGLLNIGLADFFNIELTIPSLDEQRCIGKFLHKLQEKIELEKQLLLKYENQKKYLLENLFI